MLSRGGNLGDVNYYKLVSSWKKKIDPRISFSDGAHIRSVLHHSLEPRHS